MRPLRERKRRLLEAEEEARNPSPPSPEILALLGGDTGESIDKWLADMAGDFGLGACEIVTSPPARVTCGAQTRKGGLCRGLALSNGRCKNHGGLSTGPKTKAGRDRTQAGYRLWLSTKRWLERRGRPAPELEHLVP